MNSWLNLNCCLTLMYSKTLLYNVKRPWTVYCFEFHCITADSNQGSYTKLPLLHNYLFRLWNWRRKMYQLDANSSWTNFFAMFCWFVLIGEVPYFLCTVHLDTADLGTIFSHLCLLVRYISVKGEMHKKAYELIWLHYFRFFWFLSFFPLVPPWKLWKKKLSKKAETLWGFRKS